MTFAPAMHGPHRIPATLGRGASNPCLEQVWAVLPRLLALFDGNEIAPTFGMGDRFHWGWKLIDFGNGTFQGAAHGLARLIAGNVLPDFLSEANALARIDAMFHGAGRLRRGNGSMEEAFPYESSFCVTALVAYDLLSAVELLDTRLSDTQRRAYLDIVRPMIAFLHRADEHHAFISNHLATAVAALLKWHALTGDGGEQRGIEFLDRIRREQSPEGWFREYEGADPGYQTLCLYYLADVDRLRPDLSLMEPLRKSIQFLWHFAHPDGSFGGMYGSRNTRFYYPAGLAALAPRLPEAAALSAYMLTSIRDHRTVTLDTMDAPNLIPMFNAYCWAATVEPAADALPLPCQQSDAFRLHLLLAGLIVDNGPKHYTVISTHKGGICYHFAKSEHARIDLGTLARSVNGVLFSSQAFAADNRVEMRPDGVVISSALTRVNLPRPGPMQFVILRLLNLTLMRSLTISDWIKRLLVRLLITGKKISGARVRRFIRFGPALDIRDEWETNPEQLTLETKPRTFSVMHMASQGYWQRQDTQ
ncbi:MAG TPA: hypothetical protein VFE62_18680 [Gemmataceae bacterium]|nr:hypothetical protein [Gemmataceae bacterium]